MKIFILAGESSGDNIGSLIMRELKLLNTNITFRGVGGSKMESQGLNSLFPIDRINLMGFTEIIPHIFKIKKLINQTSDFIIKFNPDVIVTIDSPGFTFRVIKQVKNKVSAKLVHVVAPSVWAYKPGRAKKYAKIYDLLLAMLPFEPKFFETEGLTTKFVGHFSFEDIIIQNPNNFREKYNISDDKKIICITPGSREAEVKRHLPYLKDAIKLLSKKHNIIPIFLAANENLKNYISNNIDLADAIVTKDDKFDLYKSSSLAIAKSGTNSFEIALCAIPQIITYKLSFLSWFIIKMMSSIQFANIINIVSSKEIIPEFLQNRATAENIFEAADLLLSNQEISTKQIRDTQNILKKLKNNNGTASQLSAKAIIDITKEKL